MSNPPELYPLLERVFLTVFPLAVIVLIAFIYARKYETDMRIPNRLNMDIFLPALIFAVMASESFDLSTYSMLSAGALVTVLGSGLIALPIARALGLGAKTFVPPMMFNNCGNLGLPLALLAFGELGLAAMMAMFLISNTLHFTLGSYIVSGSASPRKILLNPMIMATLLGLAWNLLGLPFPEFIQVLAAHAWRYRDSADAVCTRGTHEGYRPIELEDGCLWRSAFAVDQPNIRNPFCNHF